MSIGLTGKAGSGKDTVAKILEDNWYYKRFAFADALKVEYGRAKYGLDERCSDEVVIDFVNQIKERDELIEWGTNRRKEDPEYWIKRVDESIKTYFNECQERWIVPRGIVITDIRHQNELDYCLQNDFIIVKVQADDDVRIERMKKRNDKFTLDFMNDPTETFVDTVEPDYVIENNGSEEELIENVRKFILKACTDIIINCMK